MHPMSRSVARVAAILVIAVGSGAVVAVPPAMADIGADMRFVCDGATGTREVGLRIQAGAPTSGNVGEPLQLGTIKVDVGIPAALADEVAAKALGETSAPPVTGVAPAPAPAIAGVAQMRVAVDGPGRAQGSGWPAFALAAAPSSEDGTVHLTGSGVAPPLVPQASGGLSWVAGDLELNLVPSDAATKTEKAGVSLRCAAEKQTVLGTVRVRDGSQGPAPGGRSGISRQAATLAEGACKELSPPGVDPRYDFNPDPELMKIYDNPKMPDGLTPSHGSVPMCIKATGFFNIKKSGNAVPISTQSSLLRQVDSFGGDSFFGANYFEDRGYFVNQTEPVPGTVLGFGFMPTRAVAEAVQVRAPGAGKDAPVAGNYRFITLLDAFFTAPNVLEDTGIQVAAYVQVKADKAEVNGVPIDLGNKCTTGTAVLNAGAFMGNPKTGILDPIDGQTLISENFNIPAFSGCGVTEDLSPLLTASVSGAGNYVNVNSGKWCMPSNGSECVNGEGAPPNTFTVSPGGDVTAVAEPFTVESAGGGQLSCKSATMRFHLDRGHWQPRFMLARGGMSYETCVVKGPDGTVYPVQGKVTQEGDLFLNLKQIEDDGSIKFTVNNVVINAPLVVGGQECSLRLAAQQFAGFDIKEGQGKFTGTYDNGLLSLSVEGLELVGSPASTCFGLGLDFGLSVPTNFAVHPRQSITSP